MHDPSTVAFQIKYPWWHYRPWPEHARKRAVEDHKFAWNRLSDAEKAKCNLAWKDGYRDTAITIWHVDPERDGSDDSCGWSFPRLNYRQRERLKNAAWGEGREPYFLRYRDKEWRGTRAEAEAMYRGLILLVADVLDIPISYNVAARMAARHIHGPDCTDRANVFCYLPGYHTNFGDDEAEGPPFDGDRLRRRQERFEGIMAGIAVELLRVCRPWWRHPRWHFWHWKIRVEALTQFKRWAFSRCCACGGPFKWGESPVTNNWHPKGPRWFRGEPDVKHMRCDGKSKADCQKPGPIRFVGENLHGDFKGMPSDDLVIDEVQQPREDKHET